MKGPGPARRAGQGLRLPRAGDAGLGPAAGRIDVLRPSDLAKGRGAPRPFALAVRPPTYFGGFLHSSSRRWMWFLSPQPLPGRYSSKVGLCVSEPLCGVTVDELETPTSFAMFVT